MSWLLRGMCDLTGSFLAVAACLYVTAFIVGWGATHMDGHWNTVHYDSWTIQTFNALPLICFAFQNQIITPPVYAELKNHSPRLFRSVSGLAYGLLFLLYWPVGFFGVLLP